MEANRLPREAAALKAAVILSGGVNGKQGGALSKVAGCSCFCPFSGASSYFLIRLIEIFFLVSNSYPIEMVKPTLNA